MSWIIGGIPSNKTNVISEFCSTFVVEHYSSEIQFCAGGKKNLFYSRTNKWIVAGIGLVKNSHKTEVLKKDDWDKLLKQSDFENRLKQLNGHFVIIKWNNDSVSFYSDVLGLREIYLIKNNMGIFFSTNATLLSKFHNLELDFDEFGSRWMLFNQISDKSIFKNVVRVVAGKTARVSLSNKSISIFEYNWLPLKTKAKFGFNEYSSTLKSLINLDLPKTHHVSLSLSGGMDSRVILSYLLKNNISFDDHTFGNPNHPDSLIAKKLQVVLICNTNK